MIKYILILNLLFMISCGEEHKASISSTAVEGNFVVVEKMQLYYRIIKDKRTGREYILTIEGHVTPVLQ